MILLFRGCRASGGVLEIESRTTWLRIYMYSRVLYLSSSCSIILVPQVPKHSIWLAQPWHSFHWGSMFGPLLLIFHGLDGALRQSRAPLQLTTFLSNLVCIIDISPDKSITPCERSIYYSLLHCVSSMFRIFQNADANSAGFSCAIYRRRALKKWNWHCQGNNLLSGLHQF